MSHQTRSCEVPLNRRSQNMEMTETDTKRLSTPSQSSFESADLNRKNININRQFHLLNSMRQTPGGWVEHGKECSYVEVLNTLDDGAYFDEQLKLVVESQVAGSSTDLDDLWTQCCSGGEGINYATWLWHRKATFTGICLARFPLSSGTYCRVAVVSTYIISNASLVMRPFRAVESLPGRNYQSYLSHQRFRVVQFAVDLMFVTIRRFCQLDTPQVNKSGSSCAIDEWKDIERDIEAFQDQPKPFELILSLDGVGTSGYVTTGILKLLFAEFPDLDITTVFDHFYGSSAGGVATAMLWSGACTCENLQDKFQQISARIFPERPSWIGWITGNEQSKSKPVDLELFKYFPILSVSPGSGRMQKIIPELVIFAVDATEVPVRPKVYRSFWSAYSTLGMSVRASMGPPKYIPPMIVRAEDRTDEREYLELIDGGKMNKDPTTAALNDYFNYAHDDSKRNIVIISIGTDSVKRENALNFSLVSAVSEITRSNLRDLLYMGPPWRRDTLSGRYIRMQPILDKGDFDCMDKATYEKWDQIVKDFPYAHPEVWNAAKKAIEDCRASGICEARQELKQRVVDYMLAQLKICPERLPLVFKPCTLQLPKETILFQGLNGIVSNAVVVEQIAFSLGKRVVRFVSNGEIIAFRDDAWRLRTPQKYCLTDGFRVLEFAPSRYYLVSVRYPQKALGLTANGLVLVKGRNERHVFQYQTR